MNLDFYRNIFENCASPMIVLENDTIIKLVNIAFCRLSGYTKEELLGTSWITKIPPDEVERLKDYNCRRLQNDPEVPNDYESCFLSKSGKYIFAQLSVSLIQNTNQTVVSFSDITKRKMAEEAQWISENRYRSIVEFANDLIYSITVDGIIKYISPNSKELLGFDPEELIGNSVEKSYLEGNIHRIKKFLKKIAISKKGITGYEFSIKHKNGDLRWFSTSLSPMLLKKSDKISLIGIANDITEKKKVEEELYKSRTLLNTIIKNIPDIIWFKNEDGKFLICNQKMGLIFGMQPDDIIGKNDYDLSDKKSADEFRNNDKKAIKHGLIRNEEWLYSQQLDKKILIDTIKTPVFDSNKKLLGVLGIARDITERKKLEEDLAEKIFFFKESQQAGSIGSFKISMLTELWETTEVLDDILGIDESYDRSYNSLMDLIHPDDKAFVWEYIRKALETGNQQLNLEYRIIRHSDHQLRWVSEKAKANLDDKGNTISFYGTIRDITARKKDEEELRKTAERLSELNNMKDKFFSIIAHDLLNPFNTIFGYCDLLMLKVKEKENNEITSMVKNILDASQLALDLICNLMQWTRSATGRLEFNTEVYDFSAQLNKTVKLFQPTASQKKISLNLQNTNKIYMNADKAMIDTVLRNLISNAIKFTHPDGCITIEATQTKNEIEVKVIDTGVGIKQDAIDGLFRIDNNYSTTGTNNEKGTGLGLILCKEFIEKHDGRLKVESKINKGSVFSFIVPRGTTS